MQAAGDAGRCSASTWSFISEMSGDTTTAAPAQQRRELIAERLAAAGRHQHEARRPARDALDDLALAGPERREAEHTPEGLVEGGLGGRGHRITVSPGQSKAPPSGLGPKHDEPRGLRANDGTNGSRRKVGE